MHCARLTSATIREEIHLIIDLESPTSWPEDVKNYLVEHYDAFHRWELGLAGRSHLEFDPAIEGLAQVLCHHQLIGYHCTRLTDRELQVISAKGMQLPTVETLTRRIDTLVDEGEIAKDIAEVLKGRHQASDANRAGKIWFCFFPPNRASESGIGRFFRHWGGEALYNSHEDDPVTSPMLRRIGMPCIVEAIIPIPDLSEHSIPDIPMMRRYMDSCGHSGLEIFDKEGYLKADLSPSSIRAIHRFPEAKFLELSGCRDWKNLPD